MCAAKVIETASAEYDTDDYDTDSECITGTVKKEEDNYCSYDATQLLESLKNDYERSRRYRREAKNKTAAEIGCSGTLEVDCVDFCAVSNGKKHYTDKFELLDATQPSPILRRGFPFTLVIHFKRQYNPKRDSVKLILYTGSNIKERRESQITLDLKTSKEFSKNDKKEWGVFTDGCEGKDISLQVQIPSTASVGIWRATVKTRDRKRRDSLMVYKCTENIYMLFNPWDKDDAVYIEDETLRQEYVLNDIGKIYRGTSTEPQTTNWIYGQFEDVVLPACMHVLEISNLKHQARINPTMVVRAISAAVNSDDENGILKGNWVGPYDDGKAPWEWIGSVSIIEEYMKNGGKAAVKYGQCWVFAGITTTVCRALGIPCRCVTNYRSGQDTDGSLTIDRYYDEEGIDITVSVKENFDKVWVYHVWNEVWMTRRDLPPGYGGWQVIDSSPLELSEGKFQLGPCSVVAVRRGEIGYQYDTSTIFCAVNGDVIKWVRFGSPEWMMRSANTDFMGPLICTQAIGKHTDEANDSDALESLLDEYKKKEGTIEERMAVRNALRGSKVGEKCGVPRKESEDVVLNLMDVDKVMIGKPFTLKLKAENKSNTTRTISVSICASSIYYTGTIAGLIKNQTLEENLEPQKDKVLQLAITPEEYMEKLVDYSMIKIYAIATVLETKQAWSQDLDFQLKKPILNLEINKCLKVGEDSILKISFTNPIDVKLTKCLLNLECPGIVTSQRIYVSDVGPKEKFSFEEKLKPYKARQTDIVVIFNSRQLNEIIGSKELILEA